ncbi:hypothetical protein UFOVP610_3 [uncultured Caudovirales phage]|uniref:Scaffolding protein n=1 Tax=uncultured Caudovirales phage TaxID=2100421 RepID=A0A6J5N9I0_9CAUD|nr:hypothetical protein UFOVP610_3 [uncultured Caudovirales phage]
MSITIESTTDSKKEVLAAIGGLESKQEEVSEEKAASEVEETSDKITEDSEASETESDEDEVSESDKDDETEESESDEKDKSKPKKKGGFQKRIDRFKKQLSEKDQEIEFLRRDREALRAGNPNKDDLPKNEPAKGIIDISAKPKSSDFQTHEEYVEALTDWKVETKEKEREQKLKEAKVKTEYQKSVESFQSKVKSFEKEVPDFQEVLADVDDIPLSFGVQDAILTSDIGPQLMYEIAKDRKELERINSLSATAAAREIGKLEARLAKSESKEETIQKITKAPPPIAPVGSKSSGKSQKSPDDMDFKEYKAWRQQQKGL